MCENSWKRISWVIIKTSGYYNRDVSDWYYNRDVSVDMEISRIIIWVISKILLARYLNEISKIFSYCIGYAKIVDKRYFRLSCFETKEIWDRARNFIHAVLRWFCFGLARNRSFVWQWLLITVSCMAKLFNSRYTFYINYRNSILQRIYNERI